MCTTSTTFFVFGERAQLPLHALTVQSAPSFPRGWSAHVTKAKWVLAVPHTLLCLRCFRSANLARLPDVPLVLAEVEIIGLIHSLEAERARVSSIISVKWF